MSMLRKLTALVFLLILACTGALAEYKIENENGYLYMPTNSSTPRLCYFADIINTGDTWLCLNDSHLYAMGEDGQPIQETYLQQFPQTLLPGEHGYLVGNIYFFDYEEKGIDLSAIKSYSVSLKHDPDDPPSTILYPSSSWYLISEGSTYPVLCLENDTGEPLESPSFLLVLRGRDQRILYAEETCHLKIIIPQDGKSEADLFRYGELPGILPEMGYSLDGATLEYQVWGERDITTGG